MNYRLLFVWSVLALVCSAISVFADCTVTLDSTLGDGVQDVSAALQAAHDSPAISPVTGGTICIPWSSQPYIIDARRFDPSGKLYYPSVCQPKIGMLITKPNVSIVGIKSADGRKPTFKMIGLTPQHVNLQKDYSKSGMEYFSVFSFFQTSGGKIANLSFSGSNNGSATLIYTGKADPYAAPHARAVSVMGGVVDITKDGVYGSDLEGDRLLGNLIKVAPYSVANFTRNQCETLISGWKNPFPANARSYSQPYNNKFEHIVATRNFESGVNFLGGTNKSSLIDATLVGNQSAGVEAGGVGDRLETIRAYGNRYSGITMDGSNGTLSGAGTAVYSNGGYFINTSTVYGGVGLYLTGPNHQVTGGSFVGNFTQGIYSMACSGCQISGSSVHGNSMSDSSMAFSEIYLDAIEVNKPKIIPWRRDGDPFLPTYVWWQGKDRILDERGGVFNVVVDPITKAVTTTIKLNSSILPSPVTLGAIQIRLDPHILPPTSMSLPFAAVIRGYDLNSNTIKVEIPGFVQIQDGQKVLIKLGSKSKYKVVNPPASTYWP